MPAPWLSWGQTVSTGHLGAFRLKHLLICMSHSWDVIWVGPWSSSVPDVQMRKPKPRGAKARSRRHSQSASKAGSEPCVLAPFGLSSLPFPSPPLFPNTISTLRRNFKARDKGRRDSHRRSRDRTAQSPDNSPEPFHGRCPAQSLQQKVNNMLASLCVSLLRTEGSGFLRETIICTSGECMFFTHVPF